MARHIRGPYRNVWVRYFDLWVAGFKRFAGTKLAEIRLRRIQNVLQIPAVLIVLVLTLRARRNRQETEAEHRQKPGEFYFHSRNPLPRDRGYCSGARVPCSVCNVHTGFTAVGKRKNGMADGPRVFTRNKRAKEKKDTVCPVRLWLGAQASPSSPLSRKEKVFHPTLHNWRPRIFLTYFFGFTSAW